MNLVQLRRRSLMHGAALVALAASAGRTPAATAVKLAVKITYLGRNERSIIPLSLAEPILEDEGVQGARLGIGDDQTTGRFLGHGYELVERRPGAEADLGAVFAEALGAGERLFVADLAMPDLQALTPAAEQAGALLLNTRAQEDALRLDDCHRSVFHVMPSRAMKTDALAQYLVWKRWTRWFLIFGSHPADGLFADAIRHSARKFGAKIVEERLYQDTGGGRRTDSGAVQVQAQMPVFTQNAPEHDVVVVADESEVFGEYLAYRTWDPRPIVGTQGLVPTAWSRVHEQWGGTQLQRRFEKMAGRSMTERDHTAWLATRCLGEGVTRTGSNDTAKLHDYLVSDKFEVGDFKGAPVSFRRWNQQLRQPILLVTPRMLVSVSPQDQFLHQRTPLDTLGLDEPESRCRLNP
jgi:ABC transporter substrate binding protein (PQQ-dependent alcohol dehydrogenase system)